MGDSQSRPGNPSPVRSLYDVLETTTHRASPKEEAFWADNLSPDGLQYSSSAAEYERAKVRAQAEGRVLPGEEGTEEAADYRWKGLRPRGRRKGKKRKRREKKDLSLEEEGDNSLEVAGESEYNHVPMQDSLLLGGLKVADSEPWAEEEEEQQNEETPSPMLAAAIPSVKSHPGQSSSSSIIAADPDRLAAPPTVDDGGAAPAAAAAAVPSRRQGRQWGGYGGGGGYNPYYNPYNMMGSYSNGGLYGSFREYHNREEEQPRKTLF